MKTKWNDLLSCYKGSNYNMGDVVNFAKSTNVDLETTLNLVAEKFPFIKKLEMSASPRRYMAIEPEGFPFDSSAYEQMNLAASLPVFVAMGGLEKSDDGD